MKFSPVVLLWICGGLGCAKVGDPLPPLTEVPETVSDLELWQEGEDQVRLVFSMPGYVVRGVEFYRGCKEGEEDPELDRLSEQPLGSLQDLGGGRFSWTDMDPRRDLPCTYGLRFRNQRNRRSQFSNLPATIPTAPPEPPLRLRADVRESQLELSWDPPVDSHGVVGYLVNASEFVTGTTFLTTAFRFGESIEFRVQSVGRAGRPLVLSQPSEPLEVNPKDSFAPSPPRNLRVLVIEGGAQLIWDPAEEQDTEGYRVYRKGSGEAQFSSVSALIPVNRYFDPLPGASGTVAYRVTAVDSWGNEGAPCDPVSASLTP